MIVFQGHMVFLYHFHQYFTYAMTKWKERPAGNNRFHFQGSDYHVVAEFISLHNTHKQVWEQFKCLNSNACHFSFHIHHLSFNVIIYYQAQSSNTLVFFPIANMKWEECMLNIWNSIKKHALLSNLPLSNINSLLTPSTEAKYNRTIDFYTNSAIVYSLQLPQTKFILRLHCTKFSALKWLCDISPMTCTWLQVDKVLTEYTEMKRDQIN